MANRTLYGDQRADVLETLGPIVARLAEQHGISRREVLRMVGQGDPPVAPTVRPIRGAAMHKLLVAAAHYTGLPAGAVAHDQGSRAQRVRRAVVYVARVHAELSYEIIAEGLGIKADPVVEDYLAAVAFLENADKNFDSLVRDFVAALPRQKRTS